MPKRQGGKPTVEASPLAGMTYFPTALIVEQLPAGMLGATGLGGRCHRQALPVASDLTCAEGGKVRRCPV